MKAFFCYEQNFAGEWVPVVYHRERPTKSVNRQEPERTELIEIEIENEDDVNLGKLQILYPNPDLKKETFGARKEKKMVRPVEGFVTSTGQFFETQEEANLYETHRELTTTLEEAVLSFEIDSSKDGLKQITENLIYFIKENRNVVRDYINAVNDITSSEKSPDELGRQPDGDSPYDDQRVRAKGNDGVGKPPSTEDKSEGTGKATKQKTQRTGNKSDS